MQDKGGSTKSPSEVYIDGKRYISLALAAETIGVTYNTMTLRVRKGWIPGVVKHMDAQRNLPTMYIPADTELEPKCMIGHRSKRRRISPAANKHPEFPDRYRDKDGIPALTSIDVEAKAVMCADCYHVADKTRKCSSLTSYLNASTNEQYFACPRIGRKVEPIYGWVAD